MSNIKGYRELNEDEIKLINEAKELAENVGDFISKLHIHHNQTANMAIDMRWVDIAQTALQKGFMFLVRSIARPESF